MPQILPKKLTCPLKINGWKMYFLLKQSLFRGPCWVVATQRFFIFTPKIGEDEPILTNIFEMG